MGISELVFSIPPRTDDPPEAPVRGFHIGGNLKQSISWDNLIRVIGLAAGLVTTAWSINSTFKSELNGVEARLGTELRSVREDGIERRMEMRELQRRVEALEKRLMESRR